MMVSRWYHSPVLALAACATSGEHTPMELGAACPQALIEGSEAPDPSLAAIGTLGVLDPAGNFHATCTATLIGHDRVLTAKHCTLQTLGAGDAELLHFALGPDASRPERIIPVTQITRAPLNSGGVSELGSDVALLQLAFAVPEVVPMQISALAGSDLVGLEVTVYGYGFNLEGCDASATFAPLRRRGMQEVAAIHGNVFDLIYGGFSAYLHDALRFKDETSARQRYEHGYLNEGYEIWLEPGPDHSQVCFGDSGGPVLVGDGVAAELIGITSWTWPSSTRLCDHGAVVAVFGPQVRALLEDRQ
jgi:secreted trypsin-like serine protease